METVKSINIFSEMDMILNTQTRENDLQNLAIESEVLGEGRIQLHSSNKTHTEIHLVRMCTYDIKT